MVKPVEQKVVVERASLPKEKAFVGHHYGTPKKPTFEDELGLRYLTSLKGTKPNLPQTREKVKGHIEAMMEAKGLEMAERLPPAYQKALENTAESLHAAGFPKHVVGAARFAVAGALVKKLGQSEC